MSIVICFHFVYIGTTQLFSSCSKNSIFAADEHNHENVRSGFHYRYHLQGQFQDVRLRKRPNLSPSAWIEANTYLEFLLSYPPSFRNFTDELFKLTSRCRRSYSLTDGMSTVFISGNVCSTQSFMHHRRCDAWCFIYNFRNILFMSHYGDVKWPSWRLELPVHRVCSTVCSGWQQRNIKGPRYCPFVRGIHRWPVVSRTKGE